MHDQLIIYTEQLRDGHKETVNLDIDPSFLDIHEKELSCDAPVHIEGEVYVTEDHLLFHLACSTSIKLPCAICNQIISFPLNVSKIYHTILLKELSSAIFDYSSLVREEIVLKIPPFAECCNGQCPERTSLSGFLKPSEMKDTPQTYFPFSNL